MSQSPSNVTSASSVSEEKRPWPICLTGARSNFHGRFSSSLGPLIRLTGSTKSNLFALLYCAHTAHELKEKKLSFSRLHNVDGLTARKYHAFSDSEFNDLAIAHTELPDAFCSDHLIKSNIKEITASHIGENARIVSANHSFNQGITQIKSVSENSNDPIRRAQFHDLVQLETKGIPGDSGATVVSMENEVIGLIVRTDAEGFTYCNKLFKAKNLIHKLYENSKFKPDLNDIYLIT